MPPTEIDSILCQTALIAKGWRKEFGGKVDEHQSPIAGLGGRQDVYLEFNLLTRTFTWDNFQQVNQCVSMSEVFIELDVSQGEVERIIECYTAMANRRYSEMQ